MPKTSVDKMKNKTTTVAGSASKVGTKAVPNISRANRVQSSADAVTKTARRAVSTASTTRPVKSMVRANEFVPNRNTQNSSMKRIASEYLYKQRSNERAETYSKRLSRGTGATGSTSSTSGSRKIKSYK